MRTKEGQQQQQQQQRQQQQKQQQQRQQYTAATQRAATAIKKWGNDKKNGVKRRRLTKRWWIGNESFEFTAQFQPPPPVHYFLDIVIKSSLKSVVFFCVFFILFGVFQWNLGFHLCCLKSGKTRRNQIKLDWTRSTLMKYQLIHLIDRFYSAIVLVFKTSFEIAKRKLL